MTHGWKLLLIPIWALCVAGAVVIAGLAAEGETVVRLLTGDLRIGLKEGLLEEAVARAFDADPEQVRSAHMLTGDLGETARLAREQRLETAGLHPFVPVKVMLASPEPTAEDLLQRHAPASAGDRSALWLEPKFDGIRAQLHKQGDRAALFSRDLRPLDREFPELLQAALRIPGDFILDGEIIAYAEGRRLTFFDLQKRLGRLNPYQGDLFTAGPAAAEPGRPGFEVPPVRLVAFDLLLKDGSTLLDSPLADRRRALEDLLSLAHPHPAPVISPIPVIRCGTLDGIESSFKQARADGHEGLISKDAASPYTPGRRGKAWLKLKGVMPTLDCVVVAAQQGHGRRAEVLSDYTFAVRDADNGELRVIGKAYSGLTDREIEDLTDHFQRHTLEKQHRKHLVEPNLVLEIAFDAVERADDKPRHRVFFCRSAGGRVKWSATAFSFSRGGVAALESEASATNHAFGMSVGNPTGMPEIFGVKVKACPGSSKPGAVQLMQG